MKKCIVTIALILGSLISNVSFAQPIIGGTHATQGEFPYIAGLVTKSTQDLYEGSFCGASLIGPEWILTAAHCLYDDAGQKMTSGALDVFLNVLKLTAPGAGMERISVSDIYINPNYNVITTDHDIALLKLSRASAQPTVKLVGVNQSSLYQGATPVTVAGWGMYDVTKELFADGLRKVDIEVIAESTCNAATSYNGQITSNMFCAGKWEGGKDACSGDSGGPLVYYDGTTAIQTGIVSWGDGCGEAGFPGVYTRLVNYLGWINSITGIAAGAEFRNHQMGYKRITGPTSFDINMPSGLTQYRISDHTGRVFISGQFEQSMTLPFADFPSGVYYLECISGQGSTIDKLFIP